MLKSFWPLLGLPDTKYKDVLDSIINNDVTLDYSQKCWWGYRKFFRAKIYGTVTSGHPTRTTFGNTLRVILYYSYLFEKAGIKRYRMYVGGDDFFAILL
jgi:hypothetical protein